MVDGFASATLAVPARRRGGAQSGTTTAPGDSTTAPGGSTTAPGYFGGFSISGFSGWCFTDGRNISAMFIRQGGRALAGSTKT